MKSYRKELFFNLPTRRGLRNITADVQSAIDESGVREGLCPICGADRNKVSCTCLEDAQSDRAPAGTERPEDGRFAGEVTNPFSALKAMINSDEEV